MRIVILQDDFPPESFGGAGISTYELAKGLLKVGHEVYVVTAGKTSGEFEYEGLKVFKIKSQYHDRWRAYRSLYNPLIIKRLEEILVKIKPDIVHINNVHYHFSYYSIKLSKKYAKVIMTLRDAMSFSFGKLATEKYLKNFDAKLTWLDQLKQAKKRWNPLRNFIIRRYLRYADKIFVVSEALRLALEQNGINGVEVMHTGIDLSEYSVSYVKRSKKVVFFAGRLSNAKGQVAVEKAMETVSKEISDVELFTAGTNGRWLDREEMKRAYTDSDVVLVPSLCFDAFPRTVLEAMVMEKPVIGTCFGGAPEAIEDGVTGYVVNPFDTEKMAFKIIDLLKSSQKAESFGQAGRKRIETHFNLDDKIAELVKIYEKLY